MSLVDLLSKHWEIVNSLLKIQLCAQMILYMEEEVLNFDDSDTASDILNRVKELNGWIEPLVQELHEQFDKRVREPLVGEGS